MTKICVLGLGYVGLPTAAMFATHGYGVVGVDINDKIIEKLNAGEIHIEEAGLRAFVHHAIDSGNLIAKNEPEESDIFIICVATPLDKENNKADLSYVIDAAKSIVPFLKKDNLVILESTVPPRTTLDIIVPILERSGLEAGNDFYVAHCPERVLPGNLLKEIVENSRIIGGIDEKSSKLAKEVYESFVKGKIYITDSTTAEFVKLLENTYRDVNIALANEAAKISERIGINVWDAIKLANEHPRVHLHYPGPGVGGHCIPIDPWFIYEKAPDLAKLIRLSREINDSMPKYILEIVEEVLKNVVNPRITILGVAYKKNVDDTRESPALEFIRLAEKEGYKIKIHDPHIKRFEYPLLSLEESIENSDCITLMTEHDEFKDIIPEDISKLMRNRYLIDTRNALNHERWKKEGFKIKSIGNNYGD